MVSFLSEGRCRHHIDWKDRFKENTEKMRNGSLLAVAEVMKSLLILQMQKPLSFREKKMLDRARHMLITEFSTSRGLNEGRSARTCSKSALPKRNCTCPSVFSAQSRLF